MVRPVVRRVLLAYLETNRFGMLHARRAWRPQELVEAEEFAAAGGALSH
jgi:hypothetical protein